MSGDLISRSALYEKLVEIEDLARQRVIDTPTISPCYQRYVAQLNERETLKRMVFDAPTAYNLDKVVEQLEDAKSMVPVNRLLDDIINDKPKELGQLMAYDKAIKIVKAGGVE